MPGFYITNCDPVLPVNQTAAPCIREQMEIDSFTVCRNTRDQFLDDKLFAQDETHVLVLEGVILNKKELLSRFGVENLQDAVKIMVRKDPETFYQEFRGMFSGAVYFLEEKRWLIFADHIGNRAVFYYWDGKQLIVGSQLNYITDTMKHNDMKREVDENGLCQFLSFGCFMDDSTYVRGVKRILPGDYISIQDGQLSCHTYYHLPEKENPKITDEEAIALLDEKFRQAMKLGLDKNEEYSYTGIIDISGGADSRMNAYVARDLGSINEIMVNYSQSGSYEEIISKKIAQELGFQYYYNALDDAGFMLDVDEIIAMNSGTGYYCGITGGKRVLQQLSGKPLGIEFTGLLGDIYDGAMVTTNGDMAPTLDYGRYQLTSIAKLDEMNINTLNRFRTNNAFWLYTRGSLCGMSTFLTRQNYVEPYTPHGDINFMETCASIPWKRRVFDRLQLRWMSECYPDAMKHTYAATGMSLSLEFCPMASLLRKFNAVRNLLSHKFTGNSRFNMNPFVYWEQKKSWLRDFIDEYYCVSMKELMESDLINYELLQKIKRAYGENGFARYVVLSLLSSIKQFIL